MGGSQLWPFALLWVWLVDQWILFIPSLDGVFFAGLAAQLTGIVCDTALLITFYKLWSRKEPSSSKEQSSKVMAFYKLWSRSEPGSSKHEPSNVTSLERSKVSSLERPKNERSNVRSLECSKEERYKVRPIARNLSGKTVDVSNSQTCIRLHIHPAFLGGLLLLQSRTTPPKPLFVPSNPLILLIEVMWTDGLASSHVVTWSQTQDATFEPLDFVD